MEKSGFFNAMKVGDTWDRVYKAENYAEYFATFIGNGVFPNPATGLQVVGTDEMQVIVRAGKAWINGFTYINTEDLILPIDVADGVLHRIDKVVLRYDVIERDIRVGIRKGNFASDPTAPGLQRDADAYELALADIRVDAGAIKITQADITDLRLNKSLCGIVHGTVDQVDTTVIFNQFQSWYSQTKDNYDADIAKWTQTKKDAFNEWYSTNTNAFAKQFNDWYGANTGKWTSDFNVWFSTIKGQLDGDIAANLANKTNELEGKINVLSGESGEKEKLNKETFDTFKTNDFDTFKQSTKSQLADMTKQIENIDLNAEKVTLNSNKLKSKNVKGALEEVFTFASNGKEKIATAITGKGVNSNTDDSFSTLARKINQIELGAKYSSVGNKTTYRNTVIKGDYIYTLEAPNTICKYTKNGELIKKYSAEGEKIAINEKYILRASYNYVSKQINVSLYDIDTNQLILRKALEKATVGSRILMTNNYIYVPETSDRYKMLVYNNYDLSFVKEIMQENCPYFRFFEYPGGTLLKDNTLYTFYVEHWERPEIIQLKEKYAGQFDIIKFYNSNILLSLSNILSGDD